jgi:tetratricopeptide (TPR) repeat protein
MADCIPIETLLQWLADDVSPAEADAVADHVAVCVRCQSALDQETEHTGLRGCLEARERRRGSGDEDAVPSDLMLRLHTTLPPARERPDTAAQLTNPSELGSSDLTVDLGMMGPFRLLNEVGRGGMGIVYRAWDEPLKRVVALKVLRPEQAAETDRKSLIREAQLAASFHNDHAVMIHSVVDPDGGLPYLVMEYVEGPTLAEMIGSKERLEPRRVATLGAQIVLEQHQNDKGLRRELAETCLRLGVLTSDQGNKTDALALLSRSLRDLEQLAHASPNDQQIQDRLLFCLNNMGLLEADLGQTEAALHTYECAMKAVTARIRNGLGANVLRRQLAVFYGNVANLKHMRLKDDAEARRAYGQALAIQQDLVLRDPTEIGFNYDLAMTYNNLGLLTEDPIKALELLAHALAIRKQLVEKAPTSAQYRRNLA